MRIVRFKNPENSKIINGVIEGNLIFDLIGNPLLNPKKGHFLYNLNDVKLLCPCVPSKIICVALNFEGVVGYSKNMLEPLIFIKPTSCLANPYQDIINPFPDLQWWGEAELAVVIKNKIKNIKEEEASKNILGFTIANDTTVENVEKRDHHLARSKCADNFCSIGPWIDTEFDASDCIIESIQNGEVIRRARSSEQFWQWPKIISEISQWMTLNPYDVILTGNPPDTVGMRYLNDGDSYVARIEGLGVLSNSFYLSES